MKVEADAEGEAYAEKVRGKVERLALARQQRKGFWRHVAHVGSLGFVFVLPLVGGAVLGRILAERTGRPGLALVILLLGLVIGAVSSWRMIRDSFGDDEQ